MTKSAFLEKQNSLYLSHLVELPEQEWANQQYGSLIKVWRSKRLLVQLFAPIGNGQRLTICRTETHPNGMWKEDISWDELQTVKNQAGFEDRWAVEIFPPAHELVNVASMRHLWLLTEVPSFAWKRAA